MRFQINKEKIKDVFEKIFFVTKIFFRFLPTLLMIFILLSFVGGIGALFGIEGIKNVPTKEPLVYYKGAPEVAIINLEGMIINDGLGYTPNTTSSQSFLKLLDYLQKKDEILGVIIIVNSPGGLAVDSDIIANKLKALKQSKKIISYIENIGASGAYLIAAQSHRIIAHPQSIVGSIGAKIEVPVIKELSDKIGIKIETIKSGNYKDIGSPFKELSAAEQKILQNLVNQSYESFIGAVAEGRKMSIPEVKLAADGRVFSGADAQNLKLVDEVGFLEDAQKLMADLIGQAPLSYSKYYFRFSPFEKILGMFGGKFDLWESLKINLSKKLLYLWE